MSDAHMRPRLFGDYQIILESGEVFGIDSRTGQIVSDNADAKIVYDEVRVLLEALGGGTIVFGGGTFNFSAPIYLQCETGGAITDDYPSYCRLIGNGADHASEANATVLHFPAGNDGVIIDMHTNNGGWYTGSSIEDLTIAGTLASEMDSAIVFWKTAYARIRNVRIYYMGSGGHGSEFINCQMLEVDNFRTDSHIPNMTSIYIANIDAAAEGYLEQGAHQTWIRVSSSVGSGGAASASCRGWELEVPSGTANLGNLVFIDCEAVGAGAYNTAARYGWYIHNAAGAFDGISWYGCNFEGLRQDSSEYSIYIDTNAGYFYGDIYNSTFPGAYTGIQLDHSTTRLGLHSCRDQPDYIGGAGQFFWDRTITPGTIAVGTNNVYAIAGNNVCNWGQATITGAVNLVTVAHGITMCLNTNLPRVVITPRQTGFGDVWVDTVTVANFNINFTNQPGGATWLFDWWVSLDQGL